MDEMETLDHWGWHFLCSGEQLPGGQFHAAVRYKAPPDGQLRTLLLDQEKHDTAQLALKKAKQLAMNWAEERSHDGQSHAESKPFVGQHGDDI
jgi:hypothetical protein